MKPRLEVNLSWQQLQAFIFGKCYAEKENEFLLNHARSGILLSLRALNIPLGGKVGVMAYNCHTVFNAIAQAGLQPVFIDVTDWLTIDVSDLRLKSNELSALVVTHLFGIINDLSLIKDICPGIPIIEDCAHAYGINDIYGDFAVFSVGQGKLPSLGDGGILKVMNPDYVDDIRHLYVGLPGYSIGATLRLLCKLLIKALLYRPWIYSFVTEHIKRKRRVSSGKEMIVPRKMNHGISSMYEMTKNKSIISIKQRSQKAEMIINSLKSDCPEYSLFLGGNAFMLIARGGEIKELQAYFQKQRIETATHFAHCIEWAHGFGYQSGECPHTEYLIKHLLMIPTYE